MLHNLIYKMATYNLCAYMYTNQLRLKCIPNASQQDFHMNQNAFQMHSICNPDSFQMHFNAFKMRSKCCPNAFQVYPHDFKFYSKCILTFIPSAIQMQPKCHPGSLFLISRCYPRCHIWSHGVIQYVIYDSRILSRI